MMFGSTKTLIVVYKDELLLNQLKKMVETKDDMGDEQVGTRDGSINIVAWNEKVWSDQKKAGNIKDKVLFLGDIKGTEALIPVIDIQFDECGAKYGWAGNQAVLYTDIKAVTKREDYLKFVEKLKLLPIPEMIKEPLNVKMGEMLAIEDESAESEDVSNEEQKKMPNLFRKAKQMLESSVDTVGKASGKAMVLAENALRDRNAVKRQILFYGIVHLYNEGLDAFVNS